MEFRFFLHLLFALLICASVQSRRSFSSGRSSKGHFKPSHIKTTYTSRPTYHNKAPINHGTFYTKPKTPEPKNVYYSKPTPHSVIRTTAAPRTTHEYPAWANPFHAPTQQMKTPVFKDNNNRNSPHNNVGFQPSYNSSLSSHGISNPPTTRPPFGTQTYHGSLHNTPNITSTHVKPNNYSPPLTNSTFLRNPIIGTESTSYIRPTSIQQSQGAITPGPYQNPHIINQPFHATNIKPSQSMPIPNAPPYPLHPVHPTPLQTGHTIPQQHPPPYGISPGNPAPINPYHVQSSHPGNLMYPNQHPYPQPHYPGSMSNPGGSYHGGVYPGPPVVPHSGQVYYPQQAPIYHSAASPSIIMMPNQQDNGRGVGQIFKEALIYSGVNAVVNRIANPSLYHHHEYSANLGRPVASTQNTETSNTYSTTHTEITYNNQYINTVPGSNGIVSGQPGVAQPGVTVWNTSSGVPGEQAFQSGTMILKQPVAPGTTNAQPVAPGTTNAQPVAPGTPSFGQPAAPPITDFSQPGQKTAAQPAAPVGGIGSEPITNSSNSQVTDVNKLQYRIEDQELQSISEDLFNKDEFNAYKYITLNMQGRSTGANVSDQATRPLFQVMPVAYTIPTVQALRSLYEHYTLDVAVKENMTMERRMKENVLLDVFLSTNVMSITMNWLYKQGFVKDDDYEKKDMLNRLWFTQFDGTSSAFERTFVAEIFNGTTVLGVQDWVHFDYYESTNRINYLGYVDRLQFGDKAALLKVDFRFDGVLRQNGTLFVGTSPELEMALYTICYYARPGDVCRISLGGTKVNIYTNPYRYSGKDTINLALPFF